MENQSDFVNSDIVMAYRRVIEGFIQERLQLKLDKLGDDEHDKRQLLRDEHQREVWLADAARRVTQIQLASHTLKPLNPDARGTNVYLSEPFCADATLVGTHMLGIDRTDDVVGNAAALDVFKFLKLPAGDKTLLARCLDGDTVLVHAMSDDTPSADAWVAAFAGIVDSKSAVASHTLGKQLYFPLPDGSYHLLAPLFPTALAHRLHNTLQEDRFSEAAKAARTARREERSHPHGYREYLNMVVQNFGGSKPQNISQLNSERGGANHLLASVPPVWQSQGIKPPLRIVSVFSKGGPVGRDADLRYLTKLLRKFLGNVIDHNNMAVRAKRRELVHQIIDTVLAIAAQIQCLPWGWSELGDCRLSTSEKRWLDAGATDHSDAESPADEWQDEVSERFGNWLNAALSTDKTLMGDTEFLEWKHQFKEALANEA